MSLHDACSTNLERLALIGSSFLMAFGNFVCEPKESSIGMNKSHCIAVNVLHDADLGKSHNLQKTKVKQTNRIDENGISCGQATSRLSLRHRHSRIATDDNGVGISPDYLSFLCGNTSTPNFIATQPCSSNIS